MLSSVFLVEMSPSVTAAASAASRNLSWTDSFGDRSSGWARGLDKRFLVCRRLSDLLRDGCGAGGLEIVEGVDVEGKMSQRTWRGLS